MVKMHQNSSGGRARSGPLGETLRRPYPLGWGR